LAHTLGVPPCPRRRSSDLEMRGVPLRIEIGPKDVAKDAVVFARRDRPGKEGKQFGIPTAETGATAVQWLEDIQASLLKRATEFRDRKSTRLNSSHVKISYA